MTRSGYPRQVKRAEARPAARRRAASSSRSPEKDVGAWPSVTHEKDSRVEMMTRAISTRRSEGFVVRDGKLVKLDLPDTVDASVPAGMLYVRLREDWKPAGAAVHGGHAPRAWTSRSSWRAARDFDVLFTPGPRVSLDVLRPAEVDGAPGPPGQRLEPRSSEMRRGAGRAAGRSATWTRRGSPTLDAAACDRRESDEYFLFASGFTDAHHALPRQGRDRRAREDEEPAGVLRRHGPGGHPARGDLEGRHEDPVLPGDAQGREARRQESDDPLRLRRLRGLAGALVQRLRRQRLAGARAASGCSPTCAAAASSARRGTRSRAARAGRRRTTTSPRSPRTSSGARSPRPRSWASSAAARAGSW